MGHPHDVLARLAQGNERYATGAAPAHDYARERQRTRERQEPFAAVLSCADSRVPVEEIFDCGLGDLLVARTAGHLADEVVLRTLAFAVEEFHVGAIIVLGHTRCGAVRAANTPARVGSAAEWLGSRVRLSLSGTLPDEPFAAEIAHARETARRVSEVSPIRDAIGRGDLALAPALYDLASGTVTFL